MLAYEPVHMPVSSIEKYKDKLILKALSIWESLLIRISTDAKACKSLPIINIHGRQFKTGDCILGLLTDAVSKIFTKWPSQYQWFG